MFAPSSNAKISWSGKWLGLLAIIVVAVAVWAFITVNRSVQKNLSGSLRVNPEAYYAVFLTNDQVYFGKIRRMSQASLFLEDIYYLQLTQALQQGDPQTDGNNPTKRSELSLIKLGQEVHGPKDWMHINMRNVLFVEELSNESEVVKNILREQTSSSDSTSDTNVAPKGQPNNGEAPK